MAVIDAHAHIYPNKIASRAVDAVGDFYLIDMFGEGTVEHLLSAQQHAPITHFIVHSVATTPGSVESINNFIAEQCRQHVCEDTVHGSNKLCIFGLTAFIGFCKIVHMLFQCINTIHW